MDVLEPVLIGELTRRHGGEEDIKSARVKIRVGCGVERRTRDQ
jgi:hypothetical protein